MELKYILDSDVDTATDLMLRDLLSVCYLDQPVFKKQRYYYEMPKHRWVLIEAGMMVAHVAVHEKEILAGDEKIKIGAVAEVCVRRGFRGRGYVKQMLMESHAMLKSNGFPFVLLFANHPNVYIPSGYQLINNSVRFYEPETKQWKNKIFDDLMVAQLSDRQWPSIAVDFQGPKF
jgi:predicted acetyltransferase